MRVEDRGSRVISLKKLFPSLAAQLRRQIRREIQREIQQSLVSHSAARQALDIYEMRLETLDTRLAKRIMHLEDRIAELEARDALQLHRRAG
jgi:hypothetical protein